MTWHDKKGSPSLPFAVSWLLASALLAAGCADVTGDALQQDVSQLRNDVNALKVSANRTRGEAEAVAQLERRSREQAADTTRQINTLSARLESVAAELSRVSTRLDDVSRRVEALSRQSSLSRSFPPVPSTQGSGSTPGSSAGSGQTLPAVRPPAFPPTPAVPGIPGVPPRPALPSAQVPPVPAGPPSPGLPSPPAVAPPPVPAPSPPTVTVPSTPAVPSTPSPTSPTPGPSAAIPPGGRTPSPEPPRSTPTASAEESYQAAYLDFSRGRYELATAGFRDFLRRYPDSALADSAQYGIGESFYSVATAAAAQGQTDKANRAMEQAVQEFRKVMVAYPRGSKVPTALYKEALALTELKQTALARARLQYLVDHFPQSEEAPLAKERLAALKP